MDTIIETLKRRFTSANAVPVDSVRLSRHEFDEFQRLLEHAHNSVKDYIYVGAFERDGRICIDASTDEIPFGGDVLASLCIEDAKRLSGCILRAINTVKKRSA